MLCNFRQSKALFLIAREASIALSIQLSFCKKDMLVFFNRKSLTLV